MPNTVNNDGNAKNIAVSKAKPATKNALLHGVYASEVVLPWESEEDFERLYKDFKKEWAPEGPSQEQAVFSLARLHWLKHRLVRSTQIAVRRDPLVVELEASGVKTWEAAESYLKSKANADDNVMKLAKEALQELKTAVQNASQMMTAEDKDSQEIYRKIETIQSMYQKHNMTIYKQAFDMVLQPHPDSTGEPDKFIKNTNRHLVEQVYHPEYLEKFVRLEALIDARIDKMMQRIMTLKEYQRFITGAAPKQIESASVAPTCSEAI
jgi:hypothetical protein